jgi:hypothetical protein
MLPCEEDVLLLPFEEEEEATLLPFEEEEEEEATLLLYPCDEDPDIKDEELDDDIAYI